MIKIKRLGIFGGTFNPPHIGHLIIAQTALEELKLDKVIFMPSGNPPHKANSDVIDASHRFNMTKLLIKDNPSFDILDIEVKSDELSYTANTLKKLNKIYKDTDIYFIIGADALVQFPTWKNPEIICDNAKLAIAKRNEVNSDSFERSKEFVEDEYGADIKVVSMPTIQISSTQLRQRIANNLPIRYRTTDEVEEYIIKHKLYEETYNV